MRYIISGLLIVGLAAGFYSLTKSQSTPEPLSPEAGCIEEDVIMEPLHLLVFSKTAGYRHESISAGIEALEKLAEDREWTVTASEDSTVFNDETLADIDVVIFLNTTGDILDEEQKAAFEQFIQAGGGYVGIHSATDTEYGWAWYGELVGAYFADHPAISTATLILEDSTHPSAKTLPETWEHRDEWYNFHSNPRENVNVILSVDESTYEGGTMGGDHPISWAHEFDGGRAFYTALGHTSESFSEALFLEHLIGGIEWAGGRCDAPVDAEATDEADGAAPTATVHPQ
ncbi:MAG TPA: ThuA domain-containing protein [Oceanobacillus sp.]|nr:ThuA domain-containing protein [Oceanobacillus sp.]